MKTWLRHIHTGTRELWTIWRAFISSNQLEALPIRHHLSQYSWVKWKADLGAGTNIALLGFPQGMAYALIAGLPVQYGIFCAAVASIVAGLLASSRFNAVGPTNATAAMVFSAIAVYPAGQGRLDVVAILTFMVGAILIGAAFFQVATLTQYVSRTVVVGYITGAALFIIAKQLRHVLGLSETGSLFFYQAVWHALTHLAEIDFPTVFLSFVTFLAFRYFGRRFPKLPVLTLVVSALTAAAMEAGGLKVAMLDPVAPAAWQFTPPGFEPALYSELLSAALALAFLATLENTFMAKSLASHTGERVDVNQETLALGAANTFSGLLSGMPASGSLTRSALNWSSGAVTPVASICSGVLTAAVVLTCGFLIAYVPVCALAVIVIMTAWSLIQPQTIRIALRSTRSDAAVLVVTSVAVLLVPLQVAIFAGVALSVVLFLRKASSPHLAEYSFNEEGNLAELGRDVQRVDPQVSIIHVEGELFFGAADLFREEVRRVCGDMNLKVVILRMKNARHLDATTVMALAELVRYLRETDRHLLISGASRDVYRVVRDSGLLDLMGRENFFLVSVGNPNISTRNALKRAKEIIGDRNVDVRIFIGKEEGKAKAKPSTT